MAPDYNMTTAQLKTCDKPASLKMAIAQVFKRSDIETASDIMRQLKAMSAEDLAGFARIFETELGWTWPTSGTAGTPQA